MRLKFNQTKNATSVWCEFAMQLCLGKEVPDGAVLVGVEGDLCFNLLLDGQVHALHLLLVLQLVDGNG